MCCRKQMVTALVYAIRLSQSISHTDILFMSKGHIVFQKIYSSADFVPASQILTISKDHTMILHIIMKWQLVHLQDKKLTFINSRFFLLFCNIWSSTTSSICTQRIGTKQQNVRSCIYNSQLKTNDAFSYVFFYDFTHKGYVSAVSQLVFPHSQLI